MGVVGFCSAGGLKSKFDFFIRSFEDLSNFIIQKGILAMSHLIVFVLLPLLNIILKIKNLIYE